MYDLYFECFNGISGDMTVASLLDLGVPTDKLLDTLHELQIDDEFDIKVSKVNKVGVLATDFDVIVNNTNVSERNIDDVFEILNRLSDESVKELSKKIFMINADALSKAHKVDIKEVTFHEKGAIDSMIDIVSASFCINYLNVKNIYFSTLYDGSGYTKTRKGLLKVPVPAVINITNDYNIPIKITDNIGEQITPTGASIVAAVRDGNVKEKFIVKKIGIGAGKKYNDRPSVLRAMLIENDN
ncbi:MAG: LarC family nickel insertion protein [Bacilli bacterium]|nr:LarC family nickel insertion protein [Bacilli bacterium]